MDLTALAPNAWVLLAAVALDLAVGDPVYPFHPVRLMGNTLAFLERVLRSSGLNGYAGGIVLFLLLGGFWTAVWSTIVVLASAVWPPLAWALPMVLLYTLLAMRDLLKHAMAVQRAAAADDLEGARTAIAQLVGRDTTTMDLAACRRAAIESMSENLTDGFASPIFWYLLGGVPGVVLFKVVSTMDSMVGYKTPRYLRFGWCGARLDDVMNFIPARLTWLVIAGCALVMPRCSARKALSVGWGQHAIVPGPNSGWSEAAMAGAIQRRLIGPIWSKGTLVANVWLGKAEDPEAGSGSDLEQAGLVTLASGMLMTGVAAWLIAAFPVW